MIGPKVSLFIVSRHRTAELLQAIKAVQLQDYTPLELIVVADPSAAAAVLALGLPIKVAPFDLANVAAARNTGLAFAAGELVAYLDDDAVPEPTWISRLVAPFANPQVGVATGFVRGRNGISDQWRACDVDQFGWDHLVSVDRLSMTLLSGSPTKAIKAQGTNCAFRWADVMAVGGFDEGFPFYLDDADISLRLAALGGLTAVVPEAVVQHGFAASIRRRPDRVPHSLQDIGASSAYFLRRHARGCDMPAQYKAHHHAQQTRLTRQMIIGAIEPRDVGSLLASFSKGWAEGLVQDLWQPKKPNGQAVDFLQLPTEKRVGLLLVGRLWQRRNLLRQAGVEATLGKIVTVICLSPTTWYHRHKFESAGYWVQQGGVYGQSVREGMPVKFSGFSARLRQETARIGRTRPTD